MLLVYKDWYIGWDVHPPSSLTALPKLHMYTIKAVTFDTAGRELGG